MSGRLYWITGLAGAGKSTIGGRLFKYLKERESNVVCLDGDVVRSAFGNDLGYTPDDRLKCAMRYSRLCKLLTDQDIDVVCCTISMFDAVRSWNRENIEHYFEIFLDVPLAVLEKRNQKNLYKNVKVGKSFNVVGIDLMLQLPQFSDLRIVNDGRYSAEEILKIIIEEAKIY